MVVRRPRSTTEKSLTAGKSAPWNMREEFDRSRAGKVAAVTRREATSNNRTSLVPAKADVVVFKCEGKQLSLQCFRDNQVIGSIRVDAHYQMADGGFPMFGQSLCKEHIHTLGSYFDHFPMSLPEILNLLDTLRRNFSQRAFRKLEEVLSCKSVKSVVACIRSCTSSHIEISETRTTT